MFLVCCGRSCKLRHCGLFAVVSHYVNSIKHFSKIFEVAVAQVSQWLVVAAGEGGGKPQK
jgi:hypothetical protein